MDIGNPLHRVALGFAGIVSAIAVTLCIVPVGSAPANDRPAVYTGGPQAEPAQVPDRANTDAGRADEPQAERPRRDREAEPTEQAPAITNAAGEPLSVTPECEESMALAAERGLTLPKGWAIKCVGPGLDWSGNSHWGVACPYESCPEGAGPYVSISNPNYYVVAHELCHANYGNDELMADRCAAEHGASLETSPYQ